MYQSKSSHSRRPPAVLSSIRPAPRATTRGSPSASRSLNPSARGGTTAWRTNRPGVCRSTRSRPATTTSTSRIHTTPIPTRRRGSPVAGIRKTARADRGKGCWRDNVFVERLWKSVKYEEVYLRAYDSVSHAKASIEKYLNFYNVRRPHSRFARRTPDQVYFNALPLPKAA